MKKDFLKEQAIPTIDKVRELQKMAEANNLYLSVSVSIAGGCTANISIYELDGAGRLKTPAVFYESIYNMDKYVSSVRRFADALVEAKEFLEGYNGKKAELLEKQEAELAAQLKETRAALRKAKKGVRNGE